MLSVLMILVVAGVFAPAAWVADAVGNDGILRLVHPSGTVWRGSAFVAIVDGERATVFPGRMVWYVDVLSLFTGRLVLSLEHPAMDNPVRVTAVSDGLRVGPATVRLPASVLTAFGTPFNTLRLAGDMQVAWTTLQFGRESADGHAEMNWGSASSALSPVVPLGRYRLTVDLRGRTGEAELRTLEGPLRLDGRGHMDGQVIRFSGVAGAEPDRRDSLGALLGVLGKRSGDKVLLEWELRR